ncbi:MAG: hypothetical protein PHQ65_01910 [Bacteroidales bacterium]|nr:hypothetical protein [Bacteroidales bacterium]
MHTKSAVIRPNRYYNNTFEVSFHNIPCFPHNLHPFSVGRTVLQPPPPFGSGTSARGHVRC